MEDLAYTEVQTKGNPLNATRRHRKAQEKQTASTGKLSNYTPRRRRRDRVERSVATDWEGAGNRDSGMVGPLPGKQVYFCCITRKYLRLSPFGSWGNWVNFCLVTSSVLRDDRATMSDWDVKFYPGRATGHRRPLGENNFSPVKRKEQRPPPSNAHRNINFNNANGSFNLYGTQVWTVPTVNNNIICK